MTEARDPWVPPALADGRLGILEVKGRRSGRVHRVHLGFARLEDGSLVVGSAHPASQWQHNLRAAARCRFTVQGRSGEYAARELQGSELESAQAALVVRYAENAPRHRLYLLQPIAEPDPARVIRFGAQFWSQASDWPNLRDAALTAERAGWDSLWTWDHLLAIQGPWEQPIYEGWLLLAAWAVLTTRPRLGLMVGANTFRNPGHTAKLATTLDHLSDGRAVLGIGGAWFEREHEAFGLDFGSGFGERLDRLDEAVMLLRRLLDGERVTHAGPVYRLTDALCEPRPLQAHLPILVGGSGPRKTLRTVARHADAWNTAGTIEETRQRLAVLHEHCASVGRDPATIEVTASFPIILRYDRGAAEAAFADVLHHNGLTAIEGVPCLLDSPEIVADRLRPYVELGIRTFIVRLPAPYDRETLERIGDVRARLLA
ncbi:MAG: TIGR03560 family F420-dependent LLM class oxidoreductase [Candidatus Limnocylindrales bacterium]